jgi:hypothetical protein
MIIFFNKDINTLVFYPLDNIKVNIARAYLYNLNIRLYKAGLIYNRPIAKGG